MKEPFISGKGTELMIPEFQVVVMHQDVVTCMAIVADTRGGGKLLVTGRYILYEGSCYNVAVCIDVL